MIVKRHRKNLRRLAFIPILALTGCERAPAFNVLGSYFPAWLFCLVVGMILTVAARVVFRKYNLSEALSPPLLMYSCLTAFFTFALWLIFFRS
jgi:YtcA family